MRHSAALLLVGAALSACSSTRAAPPAATASRSVGPLSNGTVPWRVVVEPQEGARPLVRALDAAQKRIFAEIYILTDLRVIRALERAAAQGVDVYVLLEPHPVGMGTQPERLAEQLQAAGIAVRWTPGAFALTHAKLLVLDDTLAIVSTANLSRSAFTRNREFLAFDRSRRDVHALSNLFRADWDRLRAGETAGNLVISPVNSRATIYALLRAARRSLDVYAEEMADSGVERELVAVAQRGARVRVILPRGATPLGMQALAHGGVEVRELDAPYVHAKVIVADGREAFIGSENLSQTSLDHNREVGLLIRGRQIARLVTIFGSDWKRAKRVL